MEDGQKSDVRFGIKLLAEAEHLLNAADKYFANAGMMPNSQERQILDRSMISARNARERLERLFG